MSQKTPGKAFSPDNRPIGVFDSGIGGLTVVRALRSALPNEDICYLGDTARVPYGNKSVDSIIRFAGEDAAFLAGKGVKALIVACNTASAVAMEPLRRRFPALPVMGVIEAGIEAVDKSAFVYIDGKRRGRTEQHIDKDAHLRFFLHPLIPVR